MRRRALCLQSHEACADECRIQVARSGQAQRESYFVPKSNKDQTRNVLQFKRFRRNLIDFLKLPSDVNESQLREVLERASTNLYRSYLARAQLAEPSFRSEDTLEDTLEISASGGDGH